MKRQALITILDTLIFLFAVLEVVEELSGHPRYLSLIFPETVTQLVLLILRLLAVWHAARHLPRRLSN
jgi:hypothetical protein